MKRFMNGPRRPELLPTPPRLSVSLSQLAWMTSGLVALIVVSVIASSNLIEIYNSQKNFIVGALFSLAGFLFGKAFNRTHEQKALELIRDQPTAHIVAALSSEIKTRLHNRGAFEILSALETNVNSATNTLLRFFDSQASKLDFYQDSESLVLALDDLDHAAANLSGLRKKMEDAPDDIESTMTSIEPALASIHRDIHESDRRRIELYKYLKSRNDKALDDDSWTLLGVVASDILKADRTLGMVRGGRTLRSVREYVGEIHGYLTAALERAEDFNKSATDQDVAMPGLFNVMLRDVNEALRGINQLTLDDTASRLNRPRVQ